MSAAAAFGSSEFKAKCCCNARLTCVDSYKNGSKRKV